MSRYITRRMLSSLVALFLFLTILFFVTEVMIPGDFTYQYLMTRGAREALQRRLGLDLPLWQRYYYWLRTVLSGSLGRSLYGFPVGEYLKVLIPPTLLVFVMGAGLAFLLGQWLGKVTGWRGPGFLSSSTTFSAIVLHASFPPWLAYLVTYFFARKLGWFRSVLSDTPFSSHRGVWQDFDLSPQTIMMYTVIVFVVVWLIRTSMTDTLKEDYITTAQAKGLPDRVVRDKHAARNALLPVLSRLVVSLPYLMTGLVIIERALNWPGLSGALFDSLYNQDVPVALGALLLVGVASAVARLMLDVVYAYLDPRIRYDSVAAGGRK